MVEEVIFSFSRPKVILAFITGTVFSLLFLLLLILSFFYGNGLGIVVGAFFFFLLFIVWIDQFVSLRKCINGLPALDLTHISLIDNINDISFSWSDIKSFDDQSVYLGKGATKKYIAVSLHNEAKYLLLVTSRKRRLIAKLNSRFFGGPFSIETNAISEKRSVVLETLRNFKERFSA